jgi:hypothetical protein
MPRQVREWGELCPNPRTERGVAAPHRHRNTSLSLNTMVTCVTTVTGEARIHCPLTPATPSPGR